MSLRWPWFRRRFVALLFVLCCIAVYAGHAHAVNRWQPMGPGLNGNDVRDLFNWGDKLVVAGTFESAGGLAVRNIAVWDGAQWSALGAGWDGYTGIAVYNGQLVVAGRRPSNPVPEIAAWDGASWNTITRKVHYQMIGFNGALYGTGAFAFGPGGSSIGRRLFQWNGWDWEVMAEITGADWQLGYADLCVLGGALYTYVSPGGDVSAYDGTTWTGFGTGPFYGRCLGMVGGQLYATGNDAAENLSVSRWDGSRWERINPGFSGPCGALLTMAGFNGRLYAGGQLWEDECGVPSASVMSWDGFNWRAEGEAMDDRVLVLGKYNGELIAGGEFTESGGTSLSLIGRLADVTVPVAISWFVARETESGVALDWDINADEPHLGFNIYRSQGNTTTPLTPALLNPDARRYVDETALPGASYAYTLEAVTADNRYRSVPARVTVAPLQALQLVSSPNPFNPETRIRYTVPVDGTVRVTVFDARGHRIRVLRDASESAGTRAVYWDGTNGAGARVASGVYFVRLEAAGRRETTKITLAR